MEKLERVVVYMTKPKLDFTEPGNLLEQNIFEPSEKDTMPPIYIIDILQSESPLSSHFFLFITYTSRDRRSAKSCRSNT